MGAQGTVRYYGAIEGAKNPVYVGVEWDEKRPRGHDGIVKGKRYFSCRPGHGSCVHPKRVVSGKTLVEALSERYGAEQGDADEGGGGDSKSEGAATSGEPKTPARGTSESQPKAGGGVHFELVGEDQALDRFRKVHLLADVSADGLRVSSAGSSDALRRRLRGATNLSLEGNWLNDWNQVAAITDARTTLKEIRLSNNPLPPLPESCAAKFARTLSRLGVLVLNEVSGAWKTLVRLAPAAPHLAEFHACRNNIESVPEDVARAPLAALALVNLEFNSISSWDGVQALARLPKLSTLMLGHNRMSCIAPPRDGKRDFASLEALFAQDNKISDLASLDCLRAYPSLRHARLVRNAGLGAAFAGDESALRAFMIARVPQLTHLNLSKIRPKEREAAEMFYIKWCRGGTISTRADGKGAESEAAATAAAAVAAMGGPKAPFLDEYEKRHGKWAGAGTDRVVTKLSKKLMRLRLVYDGAAAGRAGDRVKRIPGSIPVAKLRSLCRRLFRIDANAQVEMRVVTNQSVNKSEIDAFLLDDDMQLLSHYPVATGDMVEVKASIS